MMILLNIYYTAMQFWWLYKTLLSYEIWALKKKLMLVYSIYNGLVYATVFIESNEYQYF